MKSGHNQTLDASWGALFTGTNFGRSLILAGGVSLHAIFIYVVATILPSVIADIGGVAFYAWATTFFMVGSIVAAAGAPLVSMRLGPKKAYRLALAVFSLGSVLCAITPSIHILIFGRLLQGIGGGLLTALAYTTIRQIFPEYLHARAIAMISGVWGVAALSGPLIGGLFVEFSSWRASFWTALILCALFAVLSEKFLPINSSQPTSSTKTPFGRLALLAFAALSVSAGSVPGTLSASIIGVVIALILLTMLFKLDNRSSNRLLPHGAFNPKYNLGSVSATMALLTAGTSCFAFLPYILKVSFGITPIVAGYIIATEALAWTLTALFTASVSEAQAKKLMLFSPIIMIVGMIGLTLSLGTTSIPLIAISVAIVGCGIGAGWAHLGTHMISIAPKEEQDVAAAFISTTQLISTAFGSAIAGVIVNLGGLSTTTDSGQVLQIGIYLLGAFSVLPALGVMTALRTRYQIQTSL
ncbi:MFS transporter [Peredibacter sp. HCB2-198]|uniref:MFS transporter n=1 Tax=Peredibacter sp. HCB2-198 TaxID=3383025 RepID=UPI0038B584FC